MIKFLTQTIDLAKDLIIFVSLIISFLYLIFLSGRVRQFVYKQKYSKREKVGLILVFGALGILASEYGMKFAGTTPNIRDCIAMFAGILGGPAVGIGAGLISGLYRMTGVVWTGFTGTLGQWSAVGCGVATIGAGFLGAWLAKYKNIRINTITTKWIVRIIIIAFVWQIVHIQILVPLIAPLHTDRHFLETSRLLFNNILFPMATSNALGMLLFLFMTKDAVMKREVELAEKEMVEAGIKES
ncbi:hypothetical protein KAJ89_05760 [Candidatus Parcubacteria bacterium]|nr:hypothetical protein [Candidatus Parcubacteria bacterium]